MRIKLEHDGEDTFCFLLKMDKEAAQTFITVLEKWVIDDTEKSKFQTEFIERMSTELARHVLKIV